jgi:hypothetical protein
MDSAGPPHFVETFASLDRARLAHMSGEARQQQLDARQLVWEYVDALWQDVQRAGERPEVGDKYHALTVVRSLTRSLRTVAFDAVYDVDYDAEPRGPEAAG